MLNLLMWISEGTMELIAKQRLSLSLYMIPVKVLRSTQKREIGIEEECTFLFCTIIMRKDLGVRENMFKNII